MLSSSAPVTMTGPPHFVDLHVNPGESVSIQMLDGNETILRGPATITMVSQHAYPPVPMPVQVPPGHMVQQIVDENGTLRHIILSAVNNNAGNPNGTGHPILQNAPGQQPQQQPSQCQAPNAARCNQATQPPPPPTSGQPPPPPFAAYPCCCSCCYCPTAPAAPGLPGSIPPGAVPVTHPAASLLGFPSPGTMTCGNSNTPNSSVTGRRRTPSRNSYSYSKRNHANSMGNVTGPTGGNIVNTNHPVNSIMANSGTGSPASPFHHLHPNALANQVNQQQPHTHASLSSSGIVNIASKNYSKNNHINSKQHTSLVTGMIIPTNTSGHQQTGDQNGKHSHHSSNNNGTGITSQSELISGTSVASVVSDLLKKQQPVTTSSSSKSTAKTAAAPATPSQPPTSASASSSASAAATATVAPSNSSATSTGTNSSSPSYSSSSSSNAPIALARNPGYGKTIPATTTLNSTLSSCKISKPRNQPPPPPPQQPSSSSNATSITPTTTATTGKSSVQYHDRSPSHNSIVHRECLINATCPPSSSSSSNVMTLSNTSSSVSPNSIDSSISSSSSTVSSSSTGYVSDKNSTKSIDTSSTPVHESPVPFNGSSHIKSLQSSSSPCSSSSSSSSTSYSLSYCGGGGDGKRELAPASTNSSHFSTTPNGGLSSEQSTCELVSLRNGKEPSNESKSTPNANSSSTKGKNIDSGDRVNTSKAPTELSDWQTRPSPVESLDDVTGQPVSLVSPTNESPTKKTNLNKGKTSLNSSSSNLSTPVKSSRDSTPKPSKKSILLNEPNVLLPASDTKGESTCPDAPNEFKLPGKKFKSTSKSPSIRGDRSNSNPNIERMSPKLLPDRKVWSSQELKHDQSNHNSNSNSNSKLTPVTSSNPEISTVTVDRSVDQKSPQSTIESSHIDSSFTDDLLVENEPDTESNESNCKKEHQSNGDSVVATSVARSSNSLRSSPRHLASLPQVQLLNLTYTALTASSVKLKWTLQQPTNGGTTGGGNNGEEVFSDIPNSVLSLIQKNKLSGSLFNHHFIVEMLLNKPNGNSPPSNCGQMSAGSNTGTSVRIVYQGNSNTCRVSHLNPGALYSFKVKTLISDMQHSLVSNLLTITTPEQALNSKHVKHKGTSQSSKQQNQGTSTATSHNSITSNNSTCNNSPFNSNHHGHGIDKTGHGSSVSLLDKVSDDSLDLVEFTDRKQALIILLLFTAFALVVAVVVQSLLTHDQT